MKNPVADIEASLLRFCVDFKNSQFSKGRNLAVVNLDNFTEESQWVKGDFVGISEVNIEMMASSQYRVELAFMVGTVDDKNLMRMSAITSDLANLVLPTKRIKIYDATEGGVVGQFHSRNGVRVGAPVPTKAQPLRPIFVRLETSTGPSSG